MTQEEAIKYLQQLYPNGGHCWLDEQRIEAISMAIKALQEEPISNDLEEEYDNYTKHILDCDVQFKPFTHLYNCAKHFFELGLKAQKGE